MITIKTMGRGHASCSPVKIELSASWSPRLFNLLQSNIRFFCLGWLGQKQVSAYVS